MAESSIEWTDYTFNPWIGCTKVSPGCDHCYAETQNNHRKWNGGKWGAHAPRKRTSESYWKQPLKWNRQAEHEGVRKKVFCASLADVFDNHKSILPEWRADLWELIGSTPHLDWLLLTKRPQNIANYLPNDSTKPWYRPWNRKWPWPNVWLGTTVENQKEANRRIPILLEIPSAKRFLSCEPLLEGIKLPHVDFHCDLCGGTGILAKWPKGKCHVCKGKGNIPSISTHPKFGKPSTPMRSIDWVICGGESGPNARPMHPDWARSLRDQCNNAGTLFFFKQWGEWFPADDGWNFNEAARRFQLEYGNRVKLEMHSSGHTFARIGKKNAGRLLDGKRHNAMPEAI